MTTDQSDKPFAVVLFGGILAAEIFELKLLYPQHIDASEMVDHLSTIDRFLRSALSYESFASFRDSYRGLHYENDSLPEGILAMLTQSSEYLQKKETDYTKLPSLIGDELEAVNNRVNEIRCFDCRFPNPDVDAHYASPKRYFYLLTRYWEHYRILLQHRGIAPLHWKPDPLGRFFAELRHRIRYCLDKFESQEIRSSIEDCLQLMPETSEDFNIEWECGALEMVTRTESSIVGFTVHCGNRQFPLTEEEQLFFHSVEEAEKDYERKVKLYFDKMLARAEQMNPEYNKPKQPQTPMEYISSVENRLRTLIKSAFTTSFGAKWVEEIERTIGSEEYGKAISTMQQRGVSSLEEILNYTNLRDLQNLVSSHWQVFQPKFNCGRKEFNTLLSGVLKARTEEAHNRPEHLWPQIERDRARVLCHDLLSKLKKDS